MPIWLILLLVGGGAVLVASAGKRAVDEKDVDNVVDHALAAERDPAVLRRLQFALSNAGRFAQATACMNRADALEAEVQREVAARIQATVQAPQQPGGLILALPH
jgi:hypothetical protein